MPTAQAQLAINHPNEALSSAVRAYELCTSSPSQTSSAFTISALVVKCKRAKWDRREAERLRRRNALLAELEDKIEQDAKKELDDIEERASRGGMGKVEAQEERAAIEDTAKRKIGDLRNVFAMADPTNMTPRVRTRRTESVTCLGHSVLISFKEVPEYLVDTISFELMHDRTSGPQPHQCPPRVHGR